MTDVPVAPGDLLAGKYRVERVLGSGGMGVVVAAVHEELGQRVALKFLLPRAMQNGEAASRFLREARAVVRIASEHVARVLDVGRLESGAPYLVMEYLEGTDLAEYAAGRALPVEEAVDYVLQACAGMAVAHAVGVIHRDLKPANLFITRGADGQALIKVLDFGISKMHLLDAPAALTHTSALMGSPLYMSPEQAQSPRTVDARTDIWSLGVIAYELLTGAPPFPGESLTEVLAALMVEDPVPMRELRKDLPPGLEQVVMRALERSLERRYANVGELSAALVDFAPEASRHWHERVSGVLYRAGISSVPPPVPSDRGSLGSAHGAPGGRTVEWPAGELRRTSATPPLVGATDTNWSEPPKPVKRGHGPLAAGALVALGLAAVTGWFALRKPSASAAELASASAARVETSAFAAPAEPVRSSEVAAAPSSELSPPQPPVVAPAEEASLPAPTRALAPAKEAPPAREVSRSAPAVKASRKKNPLHIEFK
jgi:serine/threonine protein kinase